MTTAVTSKGQVTIPKPMRDRLGLTAGSLVSFQLTPAGDVALVKVESGSDSPRDRFEALRGIARGGMTTDEIMALTRGED